MTKEELQERLVILEETKNSLAYIMTKLSDSDNKVGLSKREKFNIEHKNEILQLQDTLTEIKAIEWELMPNNEKQEYLKYLKDLKEKYSD